MMKETSSSLGESFIHLKCEDLSCSSIDDVKSFSKEIIPSYQSISNLRINVEPNSDLVHLIHVTAEITSIAKFGGLSDVNTSLASEDTK